MNSHAMYIDTMPVRCNICRHEWPQQVIQWAPVNVIVAHWKTLRCPECGAGWKKLAFLCKPDSADPQTD